MPTVQGGVSKLCSHKMLSWCNPFYWDHCSSKSKSWWSLARDGGSQRLATVCWTRVWLFLFHSHPRNVLGPGGRPMKTHGTDATWNIIKSHTGKENLRGGRCEVLSCCSQPQFLLTLILKNSLSSLFFLSPNSHSHKPSEVCRRKSIHTKHI